MLCFVECSFGLDSPTIVDGNSRLYSANFGISHVELNCILFDLYYEANHLQSSEHTSSVEKAIQILYGHLLHMRYPYLYDCKCKCKHFHLRMKTAEIVLGNTNCTMSTEFRDTVARNKMANSFLVYLRSISK